jgi:hypothetical protein
MMRALPLLLLAGTLAMTNSAAARATSAFAASLDALKDHGHLAANEGPRLARLAAIAAGMPSPPARP